jgi:hypothetical protein
MAEVLNNGVGPEIRATVTEAQKVRTHIRIQDSGFRNS